MASEVEIQRGKYIVIEGGEGAGKSAQARRLAEALGACLTRETGGTDIGRRIREILHDNSVTNLDPMAEAMLVSADRAQHIFEVVAPTLYSGRDLVSDRNWWSFVAYQGFGREQDIGNMYRLTRMATGELYMPDLVVVIRVTKEEARKRMTGRELDRFEQAGDEFHDLVDKGYDYLLDTYHDIGVLVDGNASPDNVYFQIRRLCRDRLGI
ncbi:dTMP kinase [Candidatus Saccharibacteria bacterium]|nr:dTMP kinase [Candidatus Saccharibacteria bacterium]